MRTSLLMIALLVGICVFAQAPPGHETEAQTVAKCLADMGSEDLDVRRRAVLILGKYRRNDQAMAAVREALGDETASVRRSALVALTEDGLPPPRAADDILAMVTDEDVQVRRIASSMIPQALAVRGGQLVISGEGAVLPRPRPMQFAAPLRQRLVQAYDDPDAIVRKNMVESYQHFREFVPKEALARRLRDEDRDVRVLALNMARWAFTPRELPAVVAPLAKDEDRLIRAELARLLGAEGFGGRPVPGAGEILEQLVDDPDWEVATLATLGAFRQGADKYEQALRERLDDPRLDGDLAGEIIRGFPRLEARGGELLLALLDHRRPRVRHLALETYGWYYPGDLPEATWKKVLTDDAANVRKLAAAMLARKRELPPGLLRFMALAKYPDLRQAALELSSRLEPEDARAVLLELLLDDNIDLRRGAILAFARRQLPDWRQVMADTLYDEDRILHHQAAHALLTAGDDQAVKFLQQYIADSGDAERSAALQRRLAPLLRKRQLEDRGRTL